MAFQYIRNKGLGVRGHPVKAKDERSLEWEQVQSILSNVEASRNEFNGHWWRDYAFILLGYSFGLRIGETVILERKNFLRLEAHEQVDLPTLKNQPRIPYSCLHCGRRIRVMVSRIGTQFACPRCGKDNMVLEPKQKVSLEIPLKDVPIIEDETQAFVLEYIESLRPNQRWLFESRLDKHISLTYGSMIFGTYVIRAGLSPKYSFHAVRHGRGRRLWSSTHDLVQVAEGLRHKSLAMAQRYASTDKETIDGYKKKLSRKKFNLASLKGKA